MKRILCLLLVLFAPVVLASVDSAPFKEGVDYKKLKSPEPTSDSSKVEVIEVFWYGCPHCYRFQPYIQEWLKNKPDNVAYVRMPAILRDDWSLHARAFYTAQTLGVLDKIHEPMFNAIHAEKRYLFSEDALMEFFAEFGVSNDDFRKTFHSFTVDSKVRRAKQMTQRYRIPGTPAVVINGKYLTGPGMAKGFANMIRVINYLVALESGKQTGNAGGQ